MAAAKKPGEAKGPTHHTPASATPATSVLSEKSSALSLPPPMIPSISAIIILDNEVPTPLTLLHLITSSPIIYLAIISDMIDMVW
jgi:hypothetical protein